MREEASTSSAVARGRRAPKGGYAARSAKSSATRLANMIPGCRSGRRTDRAHHKYASISTRPNAPYAKLMCECDARVAKALAALDARVEARQAPRQFGEGTTTIEHRGTGEVRVYPVTPLRQPIMCLADGAR